MSTGHVPAPLKDTGAVVKRDCTRVNTEGPRDQLAIAMSAMPDLLGMVESIGHRVGLVDLAGINDRNGRRAFAPGRLFQRRSSSDAAMIDPLRT